MSEAIIAAAVSAMITGGLSLIGVILSNRKQARDIEHKLEVQQAVFRTELNELTREVREHNNFARRMPVVESQIKILNETVDELRRYHMQ